MSNNNESRGKTGVTLHCLLSFPEFYPHTVVCISLSHGEIDKNPCRCLPGDGKWMELEFAGGLFQTGLDWLEIVICVKS